MCVVDSAGNKSRVTSFMPLINALEKVGGRKGRSRDVEKE